jgi:hypothetical protein
MLIRELVSSNLIKAMKPTHTLLFSLFISAFLIACSEDDPEPDPVAFQPLRLALDTIFKVDDYGDLVDPDQDFEIITTDSDWQQYLTDFNNGRTTPPLPTDVFRTTQVDFTQNLVLELKDSIRPMSKHIIAIDSVIEEQQNVRVYLHRYRGPGAATQFSARPMFIGTTAKTGKPIIFEN